MFVGVNKRSGLFGFLRTNLLILAVFGAVSVYGQENIMFFVNPYTFNPSYAGVEGRPAFFLNYRRQWVNVEGSPRTANLSFHIPLKNKVSLGAGVYGDKRGMLNTTSGIISGAYTLVLGDFKSIRFGISAGGGVSSIDLSKVSNDDSQDPALLNGGNSFLQGNAGVSMHIKSFHGGIALPSLFKPSYIAGVASEFSPLQSVIVHASNRFYSQKGKHVLEPHLLYHYNSTIPSQFEGALVYHLNNILWLGGSYRQHIGSSAFAGFHFNKVLGVGYGYTFKTASGSELNTPSHEIQLTLLLGNRRKDIPFYSFVDTDKEKRLHQQTKHTSASTAIAQNRNQKPAAKEKPPVPDANHQARLPENVSKKPAAQDKKTTPPAVVKPEEKRTEVAAATVKPAVKPQTTPQVSQQPARPAAKKLGQMPHVDDTLHPAHHEEKEKIARLEAHAANPTEHHDEHVDFHPHAERHEFVKRGGHNEELDIGDYVVAGVFRSKINAEHFAQGLKQHSFKADHGHLTEKNLWYVYIAQTDNIEKAKAERDKYRKMLIFRDAWLLTVHH